MTSIPSVLADRYELESVIGEGSFSTTYRATDRVLQRTVAVKVLRSVHADEEGFGPRFEREALAAARIDNEHVVQVHDFGHDDDLTFIVMQMVEGQTLRDFIRTESPVSQSEAIRIAAQILDGLDAVHAAGIVHRDIKPPNIMLTTELDVKVGDFGVARVSRGPSLTQTGTTLGTAAYMAPEQATGAEVSPQTDLYAVGVILYELVTGRLPFSGENPVQVMYQHVHNTPTPPSQLNRAVDARLESVILKALSKRPEDRHRSALMMRDDLLGKAVGNEPSRGEARTISAQVRLVGDSAGTVVAPTIAPASAGERHIWDLAAVLVVLSVLAFASLGAAAINILERDDDGDGSLVSGLSVRRFLSESSPNTPLNPGAIPDEIMEGSKMRFGGSEIVAGGASASDDDSGPLLGAQDASVLALELPDQPASYAVVLLTGMDDEREGRVPLRISLNDNVIYEGPSPFLDGRWTSTAWVVDDPGWVNASGNRLTIQNVAESDESPETPWIRLSDVTFYFD